MKRRTCTSILALALTVGPTTLAFAQGRGWKTIFDGKTLAGWQAPDMSYFSVEDGAITGTTTKEHNPKENQFIVWQGGTVEDFELRVRFRMFGAKPNSGIQFRGEVRDRGLVHGYQADIAPPEAGPYLGGVWDEYGPRKSLAARGERVVIDEEGKKTVAKVGDPAALVRGFDLGRWHEYRITAVGPKIVVALDGKVTAELEDRERGKAARAGVLAMPIIPGEPMKVQYKDLRLRVLGPAKGAGARTGKTPAGDAGAAAGNAAPPAAK
jgi:hypothetical protein